MEYQNDNVTRLVQASLVDPANLTEDDLAVIGQLTTQEIEMMIQIAQRAYGPGAEMIKSVDLRTGRLRICFPL
jgi:hypothetical protein